MKVEFFNETFENYYGVSIQAMRRQRVVIIERGVNSATPVDISLLGLCSERAVEPCCYVHALHRSLRGATCTYLVSADSNRVLVQMN
jgi:hypothetical protein